MRPSFLASALFLGFLVQTTPSFAEDAAPTTAAPSLPTVHVAFKAGTSPPARVYVRGPSGYTLLCTAPCKADLAVGTELRIAYADHEDEPVDAVVSDDDGSHVRVDIRRGGRGALAGGIVMISLGGTSALTGLILALAGQGLDNDRLTTAGAIAGVAGVATFLGGMFLVVDRTWEPTVRQRPDAGRRADAKQDTAASDLAVMRRPRELADTSGLPTPTMPFVLRLAF